MRNGWFPRYTAEYITPAELLQLKANDVTIERDYTFGMEEAEVKQEEARAEVLEIATPKPIEVEGISVRASHGSLYLLQIADCCTASTIHGAD